MTVPRVYMTVNDKKPLLTLKTDVYISGRCIDGSNPVNCIDGSLGVPNKQAGAK